MKAALRRVASFRSARQVQAAFNDTGSQLVSIRIPFPTDWGSQLTCSTQQSTRLEAVFQCISADKLPIHHTEKTSFRRPVVFCRRAAQLFDPPAVWKSARYHGSSGSHSVRVHIATQAADSSPGGSRTSGCCARRDVATIIKHVKPKVRRPRGSDCRGHVCVTKMSVDFAPENASEANKSRSTPCTNLC